LSDPSGAKLKAFKTAQERGYYFVFISIVIDGPELSQARVMQRVLAGGHDVPDQKLIERYPRTRENAAKALSQSDLGLVFDNSSESNPYQLMEIWEAGARTWMGSQR
jgi:predicted ABC-type ATPase